MTAVNGDDRRRFLLKSGRLAFAVSVASWLLQAGRLRAGEGPEALAQEQRLATIAEIAFLLLPIQQRSSPLYRSAALAVLQTAEQRPGAVTLVEKGVSGLNDSEDWLALTPQQRLESLSALVDTPFIGMVRWAAHEVVLRDPEVWQLLGYQGSAIEHGGYLERGFDDIDWLPAVAGGERL